MGWLLLFTYLVTGLSKVVERTYTEKFNLEKGSKLFFVKLIGLKTHSAVSSFLFYPFLKSSFERKVGRDRVARRFSKQNEILPLIKLPLFKRNQNGQTKNNE